jgi:hypothetical protein
MMKAGSQNVTSNFTAQRICFGIVHIEFHIDEKTTMKDLGFTVDIHLLFVLVNHPVKKLIRENREVNGESR